ncbi:MAG: hypothetical protein ACREIC_09585, partial [Limisphaerales bacterium]
MKTGRNPRERAPHRWTGTEVRRLGKVPDSVLAQRFQCTIKEVVAERERRGIALDTGPRRWTAREIRLLGTMNDYELARRLRRPKHEVRRQRLEFKIPPFKPRPGFRVWKPSEYRILGTMPDAEAAKKLGRTKAAVQLARVRSGIPQFNRDRFWKPEELDLLGKMSDAELAKRTGRTPMAVRAMRLARTDVRLERRVPVRPRKQWTEEQKTILRQFTVPEAATRLECSRAEVRRAREEFGMRRRAGVWTPEEDAMVGTVSDEELAARLNRSASAIQVRRAVLG